MVTDSCVDVMQEETFPGTPQPLTPVQSAQVPQQVQRLLDVFVDRGFAIKVPLLLPAPPRPAPPHPTPPHPTLHLSNTHSSFSTRSPPSHLPPPTPHPALPTRPFLLHLGHCPHPPPSSLSHISASLLPHPSPFLLNSSLCYHCLPLHQYRMAHSVYL